MKTTKQKTKQGFLGNTGMTLVELLVALSLLMLVIFCFTPLFTSYFKNIKTSGDIVSRDYTRVGLIERLLGNTGSNTGYEYEVSEIPLTMSVSDSGGNTYTMVSPTSEQEQSGYTQVIKGNNIVSTPNVVGGGFTTFYANSITANMVCFPSHISDDFKTKTITVYANGFRFNNLHNFKLQYTAEDGNVYDVNTNYYKFKQTKNSSIVELELNGDNDQINFRTSPLYIYYASYCIQIEVDAPTIVMVGEQASDGNYYYYVSSGELDEDGKMEVVAKKMNNFGIQSNQQIVLNSAMNDVKWVPADEGDGKNVDASGNAYGYYLMCGDNGQIRRFWKDSTGKYYWDGDETYYYNYKHENISSDAEKAAADSDLSLGKLTFSPTVQYTYVRTADPGMTTDDLTTISTSKDSGNGSNRYGVLLDGSGLNAVYANTIFSLSALQGRTDPLYFYTVGNLLYFGNSKGNAGEFKTWGIDNSYFLNPYDAVYRAVSQAGVYGPFISNGTFISVLRNYSVLGTLKGIVEHPYSGTTTVDATKIGASGKIGAASYDDFHGDTASANGNHITLTSANTIAFNNNQAISSNNNNPNKSYTLYCGYIPAVIDLWTPGQAINAKASVGSATAQGGKPNMYSRWKATLGVAFVENNQSSYVDALPTLYYEQKRYAFTTYTLHYDGARWTYSSVPNSAYRLSGLCGPENYGYYDEDGDYHYYSSYQKTMESMPNVFGGISMDTVSPLQIDARQVDLQKQNSTLISMSYLSHSRAMGYMTDIKANNYDLAMDQYYPGVYAWSYDRGTTFLDIANTTVEYEDGTEKTFSLAVGYTLAGLENGYDGGAIIPTVMNNGVVYIRSGGIDNERAYAGYSLTDESNIFHVFYNTGYFTRDKGSEVVGDKVVSANYWRDIMHPLFYSTYGQHYVRDSDTKHSFLAGHVMMGKQIQCVSWGTTWESAPEAMWGASDGTLMGWYINNEALGSGDNSGNAKKYNQESISAEFQSYQNLEIADEHEYVQYSYRYAGFATLGTAYLPDSLAACFNQAKGNHKQNNAYLDRCSLELYAAMGDKYSPLKYGFISPLDTIEDVAYANDIWIAVGNQGQKYPTFCGSEAVTSKSKSGSWIAVRSWEDQSGGKDSEACRSENSLAGINNYYYLWRAVQISTEENCNIVQVTHTNGMWFAVGYIDANNNNTREDSEKAVMFYALDPTKACGGTENGEWDGGWRLATSSLSSANTKYTQACHFDGSTWKTVDISSINAMASRND